MMMDAFWTAKAEDTSLIVRLYCADTKCYLRVNKNGRLFADVPQEDPSKLTDETEFLLHRVRDGKLAFKSVAYGKFLSRGTSFPRFRFPLDLFSEPSNVGLHSCFEQQGEYLLVCGLASSPRYLHVGHEQQVFPDGSRTRRNRIVWLPKGPSCAPGNVNAPAQKSDVELKDAALASDSVISAASSDTMSVTDVSAQGSGEQPAFSLLSSIPPKRRASVAQAQLPHSTLSPNTTHMIQKFNSTSSLYIKDTLQAPDLDEITWCISVAIARLVKEGHENPKKSYIDIFDERARPLNMKKGCYPTKYMEGEYTPPDPRSNKLPNEDDVFMFVNPICHKLKVKPESGVLALVYIERLISSTGLTLACFNWRKVVLSCIILATKVYEELAVWNADFKEVFPDLNSKELNMIEMELLRWLDYKVSLTGRQYAKYWFTVRELSELDPSTFQIGRAHV